MAELEIDIEYVHEMERECYEEEVQPYRKMDNKPTIIILKNPFRDMPPIRHCGHDFLQYLYSQ